jgi:hypothetical protein
MEHFAGIYHKQKKTLLFDMSITCQRISILVRIQVTEKLSSKTKEKLDGHVFRRIDTHFEKENIVLDEVTLLEHVV